MVVVAIAAVSLTTVCGLGATGSWCAQIAPTDEIVTGSVGEERPQPGQPAPSPMVTVVRQTPAAPAPKPDRTVLASTFEAIDTTSAPVATPAAEPPPRLIEISDREVANDPPPLEIASKTLETPPLKAAAAAPQPQPQPTEPELETASLATEPPAAPAEAAPASNTRVITGSGVNVRAKPAMAGARLFALKGGAQVVVTKTQKGWLYITDDRGRKGWLYSTYAE